MLLRMMVNSPKLGKDEDGGEGGTAACTRSFLDDNRTRCKTKSKTAAPQAVVVSL